MNNLKRQYKLDLPGLAPKGGNLFDRGGLLPQSLCPSLPLTISFPTGCLLTGSSPGPAPTLAGLSHSGPAADWVAAALALLAGSSGPTAAALLLWSLL